MRVPSLLQVENIRPNFFLKIKLFTIFLKLNYLLFIKIIPFLLIAPAIISLAHFLPKHSWIVRDMCDFLLFCDCAWILWSILLQSFIFCILSTKVKVNKNRISKGKVERIEYFEILRQYLYPLHFFPQKSQGEQFHCWVFRKMKMYIHTESCMWMFLIVSSVTFQNWKPPKCPLFSEWRNKLWYILTVEYYSAILENEL